uniref:EngB-type G domain-containing protein n=1 Tax=Chromera velia CCMP2878 TaxID=1169474 RepID=A0A0G4HNA7_9ALVE|eukprot:Cvel_7667.t1-p1 / transcript=Cvel_7667.t1 / gene=Cvel_7667 / organism=Chromera_velia_CCMP2878 / gene_product=Probable GTP-binding protein EngB, putative / transcript_product=Probable GTP-binding protein EngB, putative / location=Cvel_scaffold406:72891-80180(-) / protein_length=755 / sequence_SO=supercontig / SO=protein_coding / is_pseudo=false
MVKANRHKAEDRVMQKFEKKYQNFVEKKTQRGQERQLQAEKRARDDSFVRKTLNSAFGSRKQGMISALRQAKRKQKDVPKNERKSHAEVLRGYLEAKEREREGGSGGAGASFTLETEGGKKRRRLGADGPAVQVQNIPLPEATGLFTGELTTMHTRHFELKEVDKFSFVGGYTDTEVLPNTHLPEIAFIGRSNVGKSSMMNCLQLLGTKRSPARVSKTPGRTQEINLYRVSNKAGSSLCILTDLPGYGYTRGIKKGNLAAIRKYVSRYLHLRTELRLFVLLVDLSVPPQKLDIEILEDLRSSGRPFLVIGTKSDRISAQRRNESIKRIRSELNLPTWQPLVFSSVTGENMRTVWLAIRDACQGEFFVGDPEPDPESDVGDGSEGEGGDVGEWADGLERSGGEGEEGKIVKIPQISSDPLKQMEFEDLLHPRKKGTRLGAGNGHEGEQEKDDEGERGKERLREQFDSDHRRREALVHGDGEGEEEEERAWTLPPLSSSLSSSLDSMLMDQPEGEEDEDGDEEEEDRDEAAKDALAFDRRLEESTKADTETIEESDEETARKMRETAMKYGALPKPPKEDELGKWKDETPRPFNYPSGPVIDLKSHKEKNEEKTMTAAVQKAADLEEIKEAPPELAALLVEAAGDPVLKRRVERQWRRKRRLEEKGRRNIQAERAERTQGLGGPSDPSHGGGGMEAGAEELRRMYALNLEIFPEDKRPTRQQVDLMSDESVRRLKPYFIDGIQKARSEGRKALRVNE